MVSLSQPWWAAISVPSQPDDDSLGHWVPAAPGFEEIKVGSEFRFSAQKVDFWQFCDFVHQKLGNFQKMAKNLLFLVENQNSEPTFISQTFKVGEIKVGSEFCFSA